LHVEAKPMTANIVLDGVDTGHIGAADLVVTPGKHKITFQVGDDRYTYPVTVEADQTATVSKNLE
jgi:hypothetical protein